MDISVCLFQVDDYDEIFQNLSEEQRPLLVAAVDKLLREWACQAKAYLRKDGRDRYIVLIPSDELKHLEDGDFFILENVRKIDVRNHIPVTMSIGVGKVSGENNPALAGQLAQEALELALERGGNQAVVKSPERIWFYGGKTNTVGRLDQIRARVAATELERMLELCNSVVIMGHAESDLDVLGAAFGMAEVARHYGRDAKIVVDRPGGSAERLLNVLVQKEPGLFVSGDEIEGKFDSRTFLLLVDVHRPSMVVHPILIEQAGYIGVIDHHRRGEDFLERADFSYLDPNVSSTCEMVGNMVSHFGKNFRLSPLAATALLAGLIVDTKRFTFATGASTFRTAAFFMDAGADSSMIQRLFADRLESILYRAQLMQSVEILFDRFAVARGEQELPEARLAASRAADTLLEVEGVEAAFVLFPVSGGTGISARSVGTVNVHRIMEKMGGGGHFTVAGARLRGVNLKDAYIRLVEILKSDREEEK